VLRALKSLFDEQHPPADALRGHERRHLEHAVASLLHEVARVDLTEANAEQAATERALADLLELDPSESATLLAAGRERARHLTSYFAPVSVIKRDLSQPQRVRLIEHLWRIAYADGRLDPYEDHFVRKIAHLLYVPNTQCMLAGNRARSAG
jgi:uncharacterized tellurite resistance protein B-like protein